MLVAAHRPRLPRDLLLEILVELLQRHDAVAVQVGGALQALQQVVREQAVAQLGQLDGQLGRAGRRDDRAALGAREALEEEIVDVAGQRALGQEAPAAGGAGIMRVQEQDRAVGCDTLETDLRSSSGSAVEDRSSILASVGRKYVRSISLAPSPAR